MGKGSFGVSSTACAALVALLLTGPCAWPEPGPDPPRAAHDESELLRDANDIDKRISTSGQLYGKPGLDEYVQQVADSLTSPDQADRVQVRVLKSPWPNAFVLPNGSSYITTAMLDMLDNEAQLACVLGHEMTHLVERHALEEMRAQNTRLGWTGVLAVLLGAAGAYYGGGPAGSALANLTASAGQLWTLSAVSGYSRDHEREADREGFKRLVAAGYDSAQAPAVFESLLAQTPDAADQPRPYFASHPKLEERVASAKELVAAAPGAPSGRTDAERYLSTIGDLPVDQALLYVDAGEPAAAQRSLQRYLARREDDARAHYAAGEAWRLQKSAPGWAENALAEYGRAAALPGTPPDALRKKGLLHRERGENDAARDAFERFLVLDPQAVDAGLVRLYLQELQEPPK
jgi:tetratricopeptide (TPR) repeat protein